MVEEAASYAAVPPDPESWPLPNVLLAGVVRAGTTTLAAWLDGHPDVCVSMPKEPRVLLDADFPGGNEPQAFHRAGLSGYRGVFGSRGSTLRYRVDATPTSLHQATARQYAAASDEPLRVLVSLRDPAERLLSLFRFARQREGVDRTLSFPDFVEAVIAGDPHGRLAREPVLRRAFDHGCYAEELAPWREALDATQVHVVRFDDLVEAPEHVLAEIAGWLDVDPEPWAAAPATRLNPSADPRSAALNRVAFAARVLVPSGRARAALGRWYGAVGLRVGSQAGPVAEADRVEDLRTRYRDPNLRLRDEWGLDVTPWLPGAGS